jgi:anion-transporting  ArsA/GET3 family ATPase
VTPGRHAHAVLVAGAGGVGKTTISAALAMAAARDGKRTLVVTVDPARRLADALGLSELGNQPTRVAGQRHLWGAMLDVTASWEAIVRRHAAVEVADRLEENPFFRAVADRFPAAQAYAAGEQMAEFIESGTWDVLIVDTPPAVGGIEFFLAPGRMRDLVGGRLLRWLTGAHIPARRTLYRITARPVLRLADTVLGGPLLEEIAEFLLDLRTLYDGLSHRARSIERHLRSAVTVVVTTAQPTPLREATRLFTELPVAAGRPDLVVFNRTLPEAWGAGGRLRAPGLPEATRRALRDNLKRWADESRRQRQARDELAGRFGVAMASLPWLEEAPISLQGLTRLLDAAEGLPLDRLGLIGTE